MKRICFSFSGLGFTFGFLVFTAFPAFPASASLVRLFLCFLTASSLLPSPARPQRSGPQCGRGSPRRRPKKEARSPSHEGFKNRSFAFQTLCSSVCFPVLAGGGEEGGKGGERKASQIERMTSKV